MSQEHQDFTPEIFGVIEPGTYRRQGSRFWDSRIRSALRSLRGGGFKLTEISWKEAVDITGLGEELEEKRAYAERYGLVFSEWSAIRLVKARLHQMFVEKVRDPLLEQLPFPILCISDVIERNLPGVQYEDYTAFAIVLRRVG